MLMLFILNVLLAVVVAMQEHKKIKAMLFWVLIVLAFGLIGFIVYVVFGNRLKFRVKKVLIEKQKDTKFYIKFCSWFNSYKRNNIANLTTEQARLVKFIERRYKIDLWHKNYVNYYIDGGLFLNDLISELKDAKKTILMEFYIFANDETGKLISSVLKQKARDGVDIKIIYDAVGSRKTYKKFWNDLENNGIKVVQFFPPIFKLNFLNFKLNYRNHRKIVVIDGSISYIGGINLRDDHMGKDKILTPWRDTSIKIQGSASYAVTDIFLNDWTFANGERFDLNKIDYYFPKVKCFGDIVLQIIDGGAEKDEPVILNVYLKIIKDAKKYLYIQTPYFIVENEVLEQIIVAKGRGVDVKIIIPKKPDKKIVYSATLKCIKKLITKGIDIYLYDGFIHSKTLISENVLSVGSCNFDNRSFYLNFEITSLNYNYEKIAEYQNVFLQDLIKCKALNIKGYKRIYNKYRLPYIIYKLIYKAL